MGDKMRFIELTEFLEPKRKLIVNISYVLSYWQHGERTRMMLSTGDIIDVAEPYELVHTTIFKP